MCGRYAITSAPEANRTLFRYQEQPNFPPRYNVAPTQPIPIVRLSEGKRQFALVRWGLLPSWVKDPKAFTLVINARGESVLDKPAFKNAMKYRRCLIPADGFYDWQAAGGRKQPYFVRLKSGEPMAFAGLWECWSGPNGEELETATIVTTRANGPLSTIHERMPVIVPPEAFDLWLNCAQVDAGTAAALIAPAPDDALEAYPVSTDVNRVANDNAKLLEAVTPSESPPPGSPRGRRASEPGTFCIAQHPMTRNLSASMPVRSAKQAAEKLGDDQLVELARARDEAAVRALTQRYNRRLFRVARSILRDDAEAEDVVQETYVRAMTGLEHFRGDAAFGTWITRIAMNEALGRLRRRRPTVDWESYGKNRMPAEIINFPLSAMSSDPERTMAQDEIREVLENAIDELPDAFRAVFVARVVEGMSVEETADLFGLRNETVKTRLHRARNLLRDALDKQLGPALTSTFPFDGHRCESLTEKVISRLCQ